MGVFAMKQFVYRGFFFIKKRQNGGLFSVIQCKKTGIKRFASVHPRRFGIKFKKNDFVRIRGVGKQPFTKSLKNVKPVQEKQTRTNFT